MTRDDESADIRPTVGDIPDPRSLVQEKDRSDKSWEELFPRADLPSLETQERPSLSQGDAMGAAAEQTLSDAEHLALALETATPSEALAHLLVYAERNDLPVPPEGLSPEEALKASGIDPNDIPYDLADPVGRIWSAILVAEAMQKEATNSLSEEEVQKLTDGTVWTLLHEPRDIPIDDEEGTMTTGTAKGEKRAALLPVEHQAMLEKVDRDLMAAASLHLIQTLETTVPDLIRQSPTSEQPVLQENECAASPQFKLSGLIAIDGTGSALFEEDYLLSVDLGGNDCYNNTAGGASAGIAIAIDLAGDDHYTALGNTSKPVVAQGAANLGIGVLLDVSGDDEYLAYVETTAPEPGPIAPPATVIAQGGGVNVGIGVFLDLSGSDHIEARTYTSGNNATVIGQGGGDDIGIGLALSGPMSGHTDWIIDATSERHIIIETEWYREYLIGGGDVTGHGGGGSIGIGALVDVSGDDEYSATGIGGRSLMRAQGAGNGGIGVLVDAVGEDSYDVRADGFEELVTIVDSPAYCWKAFTILDTDDTEILAQGSGSNIGVGVLVDHRGVADGNTFVVNSVTGAHARTEVLNSADPTVCTNRANTTADTGTAKSLVQGAADGLAVGVLIGSVEDDVYSAQSHVDAEAVSRVLVGVERIALANATAGDALVQGQGFADVGIGIILDPLGDDTYAWDASLRSVEITNTGSGDMVSPGVKGEAATEGEGFTATLISVGWLLDLGGEDSYALDIAANNSCWTHPDSASDPLNLLSRGRDWELLSLDICI